MTAILYINDNHLLLQQGDQLSGSQGYAWLKDGDVKFDQAVEQCRLEPQQINNRYWQQCDQSAISINDSGMRHAADLVWQHLSYLKQRHDLQQLALVIPSHYQTSNMQLLLGIANTCGLQITHLINKAVLSVQGQVSEPGSYLHIDLQLHQTVCSELQVTSDTLKLTTIDVLHDVSIQAIQDALLKAMQHSFIQSDRFDPLHYAETEQQLFSQIPKAAHQIVDQGKASLLVQHNGKLHTVSIDAKQWDTALQPFYDQLQKAGSISTAQHSYLQMNNIFTDARVLPLPKSQFTVVHDAYTVPVNQLAANEGQDQLFYITELPLLETNINDLDRQANNGAASAISTDQAPVSNPSHSTHLLQGGLAVPLQRAHVETRNNQLILSRADASNALSLLRAGQLFVMSDPDRNTIQPNDRLGSQLAEGVITVIQVLE